MKVLLLMNLAQTALKPAVADASRINEEEFIRIFRKILFQDIEHPQ